MTDLNFVDRRGSGSEKWHKYPDDIIPAWIADSDYAAAEPILQAMRQRVEHGVFGYSIAPQQLQDNILTYFARRWDWRVDPQWLLYSPGLGASIHNSCRMADGGGILTPQPIYHQFRTAPAVSGGVRVDMPMELDQGQWRLPSATMQAAMQVARVAGGNGVFQLCNPHNPNGKIYSRDELLAIGEFCCEHDLLIFSDEVHADLILEDKPHIPIAALSPEIAARTITMQSPSKAYNLAGLNFACIIISDDSLRARYQKTGAGKILSHLTPFGYAAAAAAYSGECDSWLQAQREHLRANRDRLLEAVNQLSGATGVTMPPLDSTYLAWINVEALQLADAPAHFIKHGLGMSPGRDFGDDRYMRLNFACSPAQLEEIIRRFTAAVNAV